MTPQIDKHAQTLLALSEALKAELTAAHQYLLHSRMCHNWGYHSLAHHNRKEATEELAHAELLMDRIIALDGAPNMRDLFPITDCANVREQVASDLALERDAIARLNEAIRVAGDTGDNVSRRIFDQILADEDHHLGYLEGQLHIINEIGFELYLAQHINEPAQ